MSEMTLERLSGMQGAAVYDSTGDKIGSVEEIFFDESTNQPEWIGIGTGFLGTTRVLVPVHGSSFDGQAVTVAYDKEQVKNSPDIDADEISQETEADLYAYYGLDYSPHAPGGGLPVGGALDQGLTREADSPGDELSGQASVIRAEEELRVGKQDVEAGRARLRKWVETEPVAVDVELRRETARVVTEPVDEPVSAAEIGEEEAEITLHAERPVVAKEAVAKERVGLEKDVQTERETVSDEVRKERVEIEGDVRP